MTCIWSQWLPGRFRMQLMKEMLQTPCFPPPRVRNAARNNLHSFTDCPLHWASSCSCTSCAFEWALHLQVILQRNREETKQRNHHMRIQDCRHVETVNCLEKHARQVEDMCNGFIFLWFTGRKAPAEGTFCWLCPCGSKLVTDWLSFLLPSLVVSFFRGSELSKSASEGSRKSSVKFESWTWHMCIF